MSNKEKIFKVFSKCKYFWDICKIINIHKLFFFFTKNKKIFIKLNTVKSELVGGKEKKDNLKYLMSKIKLWKKLKKEAAVF